MKYTVEDTSLKAIADRLRSRSAAADPSMVFPQDFIDQVDLVYEQGRTDGYFSGKADGITEGKKAEYDRFWDAYQQNGKKTDYTYAFAGGSWTRYTFLPKYDICPSSVNTAFHKLNYNDPNWETFDLVEHLDKLGVSFDLSQSSIFSSAFMWAWIGRIGIIDCTKVSGYALTTTFSHGKIKTIDKLVVKPEIVFTNTFQNQAELVNITFEGTIGNAISFQWSTKLSKASIESVISHLSTTASGLSVTFSKTAVNNAFADAEWATLANTRSNWTINLV